jgi:hypothetical protein
MYPIKDANSIYSTLLGSKEHLGWRFKLQDRALYRLSICASKAANAAFLHILWAPLSFYKVQLANISSFPTRRPMKGGPGRAAMAGARRLSHLSAHPFRTTIYNSDLPSILIVTTLYYTLPPPY